MQRALGARARCASSDPSQLRRMIRNGSVRAMSPSSACCPAPLQSAYGRDQVSLIKSGRSCIQSSLLTPPG